MHSNFSSCGTVLQTEIRQSKQGNMYSVITLKIGEYQGRPDILQVTFAGKSFEMSQQAHQGDEVAISGIVRSKQKDNGYIDTDVYPTGLVVIRSAQQTGGFQQPQYGQPQYSQPQYGQPTQNPYSDKDIPF